MDCKVWATLLIIVAVFLSCGNVDASDESLVATSKNKSSVRERTLFGLLGNLGRPVFGVLNHEILEPVTQLIQGQLQLSGVLSLTSDITTFLKKLPVMLVVDPVGGFTSLFENLAEIGQALQALAVGRLTCVGCFFAIGFLQFLMAAGMTEDEMAEVAIQFCITFKLYDEVECTGSINNQKHMTLTSLKYSKYNLNEICAILVSYECGTEPEEGKWEVTIPANKPPVKTYTSPTGEPKKLVFLHFTDPHVDVNYTSGTPSDCGRQICCHTDSPASKSNVIGGKFGGPIYCEIPFSTFKLILEDAKKEYGEPAAILWTGDQPPHDFYYESRLNHETANAAVDGVLKDYFPNTPIFPALGNHDSHPTNSFPPIAPNVPEMDNNTWLYDQAVALWIPVWLPVENTETVRRGGFYSVKTKYPGLRIIALNNNLCHFGDLWLLINAKDPLGQLAWVTQELLAAEKNQEKVFLIMHIPPGSNDCLKVWSANFYKIVNRFESTIIGQCSGHTHLDNFMVYYEKGRPTNVMYVTPSMTTYENFNLGYRAFIMDADSLTILNTAVHYLLLDQSNTAGVPQFQKLYDAKAAYDMESLEPSEWDKVIKKVELDDVYWNRFYTYYHRNSSYFAGCDDSCKKALVCQLRSARSRDPTQC